MPFPALCRIQFAVILQLLLRGLGYVSCLPYIGGCRIDLGTFGIRHPRVLQFVWANFNTSALSSALDLLIGSERAEFQGSIMICFFGLWLRYLLVIPLFAILMKWIISVASGVFSAATLTSTALILFLTATAAAFKLALAGIIVR